MSAAPHGEGFDARGWLAALVAIGGGYALASDRKLHLLVDDCDPHELAPVVGEVLGHPERVDAVRDAIERRSVDEVL